MRHSAATAILAVAAVASLTSGQEPRKPVYFSFIVSNGENGYRSSGAVPAIDIALEAVDKLQLLREYNLTYETVKNSKVVTAYWLQFLAIQYPVHLDELANNALIRPALL